MTFPAEMRVDYVRVYQRTGQTNIGCSPADYPTKEYIKQHMDSYMSSSIFLSFEEILTDYLRS